MLKEIDDFVLDEFGAYVYKSYERTAYSSIHVADYKYAVETWAQNRIESLNKLLELVEKLPDDEVREYEVPA